MAKTRTKIRNIADIINPGPVYDKLRAVLKEAIANSRYTFYGAETIERCKYHLSIDICVDEDRVRYARFKIEGSDTALDRLDDPSIRALFARYIGDAAKDIERRKAKIRKDLKREEFIERFLEAKKDYVTGVNANDVERVAERLKSKADELNKLACRLLDPKVVVPGTYKWLKAVDVVKLNNVLENSTSWGENVLADAATNKAIQEIEQLKVRAAHSVGEISAIRKLGRLEFDKNFAEDEV